AETIVAGTCPCRKEMKDRGLGCGKPMDTCFMFGAMARYYMDHGLGRQIDFSEAVALLSDAHAAGLVSQPATAQNPGGLCNCCSCCCSVLATLSKYPRPAEMVTATYTARVDPDLCCTCETCTDRCPMQAPAINAEGIAAIQPERCIGCGLCVAACPAGAIELVAKNG
ncbi:MAG: 4Fe-4S binding protein, partial [Thermodesulfobacteriota bacterium]